MNNKGIRPPFADRLRKGLEEGIEHAKGSRHLKTALVVAPQARQYDAADVVRIRKRLELSQIEFARYLRVNVKTLQSWEQGLRKPSRPTMRLLQIFDEPGQFAELLKIPA